VRFTFSFSEWIFKRGLVSLRGSELFAGLASTSPHPIRCGWQLIKALGKKAEASASRIGPKIATQIDRSTKFVSALLKIVTSSVRA